MTNSEYGTRPPSNDSENESQDTYVSSERVGRDSKVIAQAIVFSALAISGSGLLALTATTGIDSFYPLFAFGAGVYVAWRRFF